MGSEEDEIKQSILNLELPTRDLSEVQLKKIITDAGYGNCADYSRLILEAAKTYSIPDPLILVAIMKQESDCKVDASSGSSFGLMQISSWQDCKDELSLKSIEDIKGQGKIANNINCGTIIFKKKYSDSSKNYNCDSYTYTTIKSKSEEAIDVVYSKWAYALRGYNGWSCAGKRTDGTEISADQNYVEDVVNKYNGLVKIADAEINEGVIKNTESSSESTTTTSGEKTYDIEFYGFLVEGNDGYRDYADTDDEVYFNVLHTCDSVDVDIRTDAKFLNLIPYKKIVGYKTRDIRGEFINLGNLDVGIYYVLRLDCIENNEIKYSLNEKEVDKNIKITKPENLVEFDSDYSTNP